jgi:ribonuclease P protein component
MIGRLVQAADFQRLLAAPRLQRSDHFSIHHIQGRPAVAAARAVKAESTNLSTAHEPSCPQVVDDLPEPAAGRWLGCVVPKRHARRAVTRNMLKRQIRAAVARHESQLPMGLWLVRLRGPFVAAKYPSADSAALRAAARGELDLLLQRVAGMAAPAHGAV